MTKQQYIEYLICTPGGNYTCTNLANHLDGEPGTSHDAISDFLRRDKLTPRSLWEVVQSLLHDGPDSCLIVDDSVQDKRYSKQIEMVKLQYSGAAGGLVRGIGVIDLLHTSGAGGVFFPVDFRLYNPDDPGGDGRTKNQHFRDMLVRAKSDKRLQANTVLFDTWYASVDNLKLIHRTLGMFFVTCLKSNRLVSLSKEQGYCHLQEMVWTDEQLRHGLAVKLKELPFLVRLFKVVAPNGDIDWVITNRDTLGSGSDGDTQRPFTVQDVQGANGLRWQIEQMHRELKQLVGTEKCQCRKARSQRNHLTCCYLAWLSLKVAANKAGDTLYARRASLFREFLRAQLRNPTIRAYQLC
jgi:hypothetical protein